MGGSHSWISHRVVKKAMKDFFDWPYRVRFWTVKSSKKKFPFVVDHHQTNKCPSNFLIFYINARFTQPNETQATCTIIPTMQLVPLGSHIYSQTIYTLEVEHLLHRMNCLACCCNVYCCVNINLKKQTSMNLAPPSPRCPFTIFVSLAHSSISWKGRPTPIMEGVPRKGV